MSLLAIRLLNPLVCPLSIRRISPLLHPLLNPPDCRLAYLLLSRRGNRAGNQVGNLHRSLLVCLRLSRPYNRRGSPRDSRRRNPLFVRVCLYHLNRVLFLLLLPHLLRACFRRFLPLLALLLPL